MAPRLIYLCVGFVWERVNSSRAAEASLITHPGRHLEDINVQNGCTQWVVQNQKSDLFGIKRETKSGT